MCQRRCSNLAHLKNLETTLLACKKPTGISHLHHRWPNKKTLLPAVHALDVNCSAAQNTTGSKMRDVLGNREPFLWAVHQQGDECYVFCCSTICYRQSRGRFAYKSNRNSPQRNKSCTGTSTTVAHLDAATCQLYTRLEAISWPDTR